MTPRKIVQITAYPPPRCGWGVRVQYLKQRLEELGHTCVVLNIGPSRKIPSDEYETVLSGWDYVRKVWRFSRAGYVAHVHTNGKAIPGLVLALVAEIINLLWGHRCFLTFHAGEDQRYFPRSRAPWLMPLFWILFAIPRRIICNNDAVKRGIAAYGVTPNKVVPIPAFSRQYLEFGAASLGETLEAFYRRYARVLLSYTHIQPTYHPDVLVEAFGQIARTRPDVGLVICGSLGRRDERLWSGLRARTAELGVTERVLCVGDLDHDQFLTALSRSAAYVRTTPADGVSSSVLEALGLGVPVVAAQNGTRPPGVITYQALNADTLRLRLLEVMEARDHASPEAPPNPIADTLETEVRLLLG